MSHELKLKDFRDLVGEGEPPQILQLFLWMWLFGASDPKDTAEGVKTLEEAGFEVKWSSMQPNGLRRVSVVVEGITLVVTVDLSNDHYHNTMLALNRA